MSDWFVIPFVVIYLGCAVWLTVNYPLIIVGLLAFNYLLYKRYALYNR